jgi:hypothetical protein
LPLHRRMQHRAEKSSFGGGRGWHVGSL